MITEQEFLAAIAAAPHDTATRFVYADWLDERGDSRADLIRAHEELQTRSPLDADFWEAKEAVQTLRWPLEESWLAQLGYDCRYRPLFSRRYDDRAAFWRAIERFVELWHTPLSRECGHTPGEFALAEQRIGVRLPAALRELYQIAGKRLDLWRIHWPVGRFEADWWESVVPLSELKFDARLNAIAFAEHNDWPAFYVRSKDLTEDDPPVWATNHSMSLIRVSPRLTEFVAHWLFLATQHSSQFLVSERPVDDREIPACFSLARLPNRHGALTPIRVLESVDAYLLHLPARQQLLIVARSNRVLTNMSADEIAGLRRISGLTQFGRLPERSPTEEDDLSCCVDHIVEE